MKSEIKRPPEVEAEIEHAEEHGDFEQAGYLAAPGLKEHTGNSLEKMLLVCELMTLVPGKADSFYQRTQGVRRWTIEQMEKENDQ